MHDDPLMFAIDLTRTSNKRTADYVNGLMTSGNFIVNGNADLKTLMRGSTGTKFQTYLFMNSNCTVPDVYNRRDNVIPEYMRISYSRMRLSSHRLEIETGRWARIPRERRLCQCGAIQDEEHVLLRCALTEPLRHKYGKPILFS